MPSRVIRADINSSESLSHVSMQAELTFDRLILAADDFGRFDARPQVLKAHLFPMRDEVSPADVVRWVEELAALDDPPVRLYEVDGRPYLMLTGWEKHRSNTRRASESKYPEPAENEYRTSVKSADISDPPDPREIRPGLGGMVSGVESRVSGVVPPEPADPKPPRPKPQQRGKPPKPELTQAPPTLSAEDMDRLREWLPTRGFDWFESELRAEVENCLGHFRAEAKPKADWIATARNWIAKAINGGGGFPPMDPERRERIAKRTRHQQAAQRIDAATAAARASPTEPEPDLSDEALPELPEGMVVNLGARR